MSSNTFSEEHLERSIQMEQSIQNNEFDLNPDLELESNYDFSSGESNGGGMEPTWGEVCHACCVRSPSEWASVLMGCVVATFFLYFFLFGLDLLGTGAKVMGGCTAGALFGDDMNPVAGLMVGIVATVLLQSSSTTTSIVVSLVGADTVSVRQGIYMIMGANIGTSVTNTIVAVGHMGDGDQLELAFAGATVHDMFNFLSVAVLMPIEVISGFLFHFTERIIRDFRSQDGEKWEGPVKRLVSPLAKRVIIANSDVTANIAKRRATCGTFYPSNGTLACEDYNDPLSCKPGLIKCDTKGDVPYCPSFFDAEATEAADKTAGVCAFIIGLIVLFICLFALIKILQAMLIGASTRLLYKATSINGYVSILIGTGITMLVQSSSITTSVLTPLVGVGVLRLEQMLPLTLGANLGTTMTAILAALLSKPTAMQVALAHLIFNMVGILIWYPLPAMRSVPLGAARRLGKATRMWRGMPILYLLVTFLVLPITILGISYLFTTGNSGITVLGSLIVVILLTALGSLIFFCKFRGGSDKFIDFIVKREKRNVALNELHDDMEHLKSEVRRLQAHTAMRNEREESQKKNTQNDDKVESSSTSGTARGDQEESLEEGLKLPVTRDLEEDD
ncbi:unnamed protein product [Cylindrotheca closterium]|uniref:Sodium-dependent phosphate transport protein 2B n=1 Tax=Cylindrotheca closterium TaxID=2856 RepID=A0AAD2CX30_9STRA|nr:unnamed protein product [Cylindrotheca closterium]